MNITFDPKKDAINQAKHGISLAMASNLDWNTAFVWTDERKEYGEYRQAALAVLNGRLHSVVFVDRIDCRRIISLRKCNEREAKIYAKND